MKIEFTLKYKANNTNKALETIDKIKSMAKNRDININELDIKIEDKETNQIEIYPGIFLQDKEKIDTKTEQFITDYLTALDFDNDLLVDTMKIKHGV